MIVFDSVTKKYKNGTLALDNVSFAIGEGEFVVIEGASGAGKTSLMRGIIRDIDIDQGKIVIDGDNIKSIPDKNIPLLRRKVGVVFQDFKLLSDRTIAENIDLALDILGLSESTAKKRRKELLELTGLAEKENDFPSQLSGGELQRVAIARALAPQPKILFADEPTGNLDKKTGMSIIELLHEINQHGTTVVLASHDLELLKNLKVRRLKFDHGQLIHDSAAHHHKPSIEEKKSDTVEETKEEMKEETDEKT
jgi:cell division transport system ATP-binding protein